jgi:hypothetical protein
MGNSSIPFSKTKSLNALCAPLRMFHGQFFFCPPPQNQEMECNVWIEFGFMILPIEAVCLLELLPAKSSVYVSLNDIVSHGQK